jgi:ATP-binding protein involved in chromosome partitioning
MQKRDIRAQIPNGLAKVKNIVAIGSGKGGVGKSTVATLLAHGLKNKGFRVGLMDADIYGPSQLKLIGAPDKAPEDNKPSPIERNGIKFISMAAYKQGDTPAIMRAPMVVKWLQFFLGGIDWGELDYFLIDLPPGTGDIQLTLAQQGHLTGAVIVSTANELALEVAQKGAAMFQQVNVPIIGMVENMSSYMCGHCDKPSKVFPGPGVEGFSNKKSFPYLGELSLTPKVANIEEGFDEIYQDSSLHAFRTQIEQLTDNLIKQVNQVNGNLDELWPSQMQLNESSQLAIQWQGQDSLVFDTLKLRLACPCAACVDEMSGKVKLDPTSVSENIKITTARVVGRYGLNLTFSDGHSTGIYKFERLKDPSLFGTSQVKENTPTETFEKLETDDPQLMEQVQELIDEQVTPSLAGHGGYMKVQGLKDGVLFVEFGGGCQGCAQIDMTLKEGVQKLIQENFPGIKTVQDLTKHTDGSNPYFT